MKKPAYHPFRSERAKERYLDLYDTRAKLWPVSSECLTLDTSYGQTFVRISGPTDAPALVMLPGARSASLMWIPVIRSLSERFRTYAVDNVYDYGRSVWTRAIGGPDDFTAWLDELMSALGLAEGINLLGISYGGWLAGRYALRFPHRLARVVVLGPAGILRPRPVFMLRAALTILPLPCFTRSLIYWLFGDSVRHDRRNRAFLKGVVKEMCIASRSFKLRRLIEPVVFTDSELAGIIVPALVLIGEEERIYSARKALMRLTMVAPQIEGAIIPHAGHGLTLYGTGMVEEKILQFLERDRPGMAFA